MTLKDFWELNIRGNAEQQMKKMTTAGNKLVKSFSSGQRMASKFGPQLKGAANSVGALEDRLRRLKERQRQAFDPKHIARYNRMIQQTEGRLRKLNNLGVRRGGMLGGMGGMMRTAASYAMPLGVAGGLIMGGANAYGRVMNFDQEMSRVKAISGAKGADLQGLKDTAINVGGSTPFTASEAASGIRYLSMAGFTAQQSMSAMPASASLAMAGDVGLDRSADVLSNVLGQFEMEAFRSADVANIIAATTASSNTNFEQMSEALKYLGPTMHAMNMSLEETSSIIGALGDAGIQGSLAGRALGTSLVRLAKPTDKMQESIDALGLRLWKSNGEFVGMAGMLRQLEEGTRNLTDQQRAAHLQAIFGSEAYQEMSILLNKGSEAFDEYTQSITGTNKAAQMARDTQDNLKGDLLKLNSVWEKLILTIDSGQGVISEFFRNVTNGLSASINNVTTREKFGISHANAIGLGFMSEETQAQERMVKEYQDMERGLAGIATKGGSAEDQINQYNLMKDLVNQAFDLKQEGQTWYMTGKEATKENVKIANAMRSDLMNRINNTIASIKGQSGKAVKPKSGEALQSSSVVDEAVDSVNGGGKRTRNVIVNIKALNEGGIHNHVATAGEAEKLSEDKLVELFIRAVRGGELMLVQGEY